MKGKALHADILILISVYNKHQKVNNKLLFPNIQRSRINLKFYYMPSCRGFRQISKFDIAVNCTDKHIAKIHHKI